MDPKAIFSDFPNGANLGNIVSAHWTSIQRLKKKGSIRSARTRLNRLSDALMDSVLQDIDGRIRRAAQEDGLEVLLSE